METLRRYGNPPFSLAVIHGGPGAPGEMAPVARELSAFRGVLEPLQTAMTLEGQVRELQEVLKEHGNLPITLIGFSWGAMLSFIFTARYPELVIGKLMSKADAYHPLPYKDELIQCSYESFKGVWEEASELRSCGKLLELGKEIRCQVIAVHGDYDPHPFEGVKEPLSRILKDFRFILLEKCGHRPWIEREAKERFYSLLRSEI